jgi:tetratricopeptide (TPR) repeat protein
VREKLDLILDQFIGKITNDPKIAESLENLLKEDIDKQLKKEVFIWLCYYIYNYIFERKYFKDLISRYENYAEDRDELDAYIYMMAGVLGDADDMDKEKVLELYKRSAQLAPDGVINLASLAELENEMGLKNDAKLHWAQALSNYNANLDIVDERGMIYSWVSGINSLITKNHIEKKLEDFSH